jgi:hypothetical protein
MVSRPPDLNPNGLAMGLGCGNGNGAAMAGFRSGRRVPVPGAARVLRVSGTGRAEGVPAGDGPTARPVPGEVRRIIKSVGPAQAVGHRAG